MRVLPLLSWTLGAVLTAATLPAAESGGISGPRELLEIYGIDQSHFGQLSDGVVWQEGENELLWKILFRLESFRAAELERWAQPLNVEQLVADAPGYRGEAFRLEGRVTAVERLATVPETAQRMSMSDYYRCELAVGEASQAVTVFARQVPEAWKKTDKLNERAGALGLFLKLGAEVECRARPVFAASRVAWYPATALGDLGMDVGRFDDLHLADELEEDFAAIAGEHLEQFRLTARNREAFYEMLAAADRAGEGQLERLADAELRRRGAAQPSVVPLFNTPLEQRGKLFRLRGAARSVLEVRVDDKDIRERFGIERYYQIALFTPDSQGNPVIFCVRSLPPGISPGTGPQYQEAMSIAGFFFNTWAYRNGEPAPAGSPANWQLAPLLIGRQPQRIAEPAAVGRQWFGLAAGVVVVAIAASILASIWRRQGPRRARASAPADSAMPASPDFSRLEQ